jgi:hypothetical protein
MKNKEFDSVEMKYRAAEEIGNKLKHFSPKERLSYWNKRFQKIKTRMTKRTNVTK